MTARTVIGMGDSIMTGNGIESWLSRVMFPPVWTVANLAVASRTLIACAGNGTNDWLSHISSLDPYWDASNPFVIVRHAGSNDAFFEGPSIQAGTKPSMSSRLSQVTSALLSRFPGARIVDCEPLPRGSDNWSLSSAWAGSAVPFDACLSDLTAAIRAGSANAIVNFNGDASRPFASPNTNPLYRDACHPAASGYDVMFGVYSAAMSLGRS